MGRDEFSVRCGLDEAQRAEAAQLYWQAFGAKLGLVLGPERRAFAYLTRVIRADHAVCAIDADGALIGVAGFKTAHGSFTPITFKDLCVIYGYPGAIWRAAMIAALSREVENRRFLMDGICVAETARGRGVGRALLAAICDEAQMRGFREVRLDVVDHNIRARALYEREGFVAVRSTGIGLLRLVFGFRSSTTMVREVL